MFFKRRLRDVDSDKHDEQTFLAVLISETAITTSLPTFESIFDRFCLNSSTWIEMPIAMPAYRYWRCATKTSVPQRTKDQFEIPCFKCLPVVFIRCSKQNNWYITKILKGNCRKISGSQTSWDFTYITLLMTMYQRLRYLSLCIVSRKLHTSQTTLEGEPGASEIHFAPVQIPWVFQLWWMEVQTCKCVYNDTNLPQYTWFHRKEESNLNIILLPFVPIHNVAAVDLTAQNHVIHRCTQLMYLSLPRRDVSGLCLKPLCLVVQAATHDCQSWMELLVCTRSLLILMTTRKTLPYLHSGEICLPVPLITRPKVKGKSSQKYALQGSVLH